LGGVAASGRHGRAPVTAEVQSERGPGPVDEGGYPVRGALAEAVQQQQGPGGGIGGIDAAQLVQGQVDPVVTQRADAAHDQPPAGAPAVRCSSTRSATSRGCSMWTKWPTPSNA